MDMVINKTGSVCKYKLNMEVRLCNHCYCGKEIGITYSEYVFVDWLSSRIALSFVACLVPPYFSTISHKRYYFRRSLLNKNLCFDFLCGFCLKYASF